MERKIYQLTDKQIAKAVASRFDMPSDDEIKSRWMEAHHGKVTGWGMEKAELTRKQLKGDVEYQRGIWQGRVDRANDVEYNEERTTSSYNMGYHEGYSNYESDRRGWDQNTRDWFDQNWIG